MKHEEIMVCECSDSEHQIVFQYDDDDEIPTVYASIHMTDGGFWWRLKHAFRYLFGFKCIYGHFDEFFFKKEHIAKLQQIIEYLNKN